MQKLSLALGAARETIGIVSNLGTYLTIATYLTVHAIEHSALELLLVTLPVTYNQHLARAYIAPRTV